MDRNSSQSETPVGPVKKTGIDRLDAYIAGIRSGEIVAGKYVKRAVERFVYDLETSKQKGFAFYPAAAQKVIDFVEGYCRHWKGKWAGQAFILSDFQIFIVASIYGWLNMETGLRRTRRVYVRIARKNGKSLFAAALCLYCLFQDNESGAEIYSCATKKDQALIVWKDCEHMVESSPDLKRHLRIYQTKNRIVHRDSGSVLTALGRDADTMDGLGPHMYVLDELHAHKTRECYDVMSSACGSRSNYIQMAITTSGVNDPDGICVEVDAECMSVLDNFDQPDMHVDEAVFAYIAELDDGDDWQDESVWIKANPNLGISVSLQSLRDQCEKAKSSPMALNNFLCKNLNQWVDAAVAWLSMLQWNQCDTPTEVKDGDTCYGALDLSKSKDLTAFAMVFPPDDMETGDFSILCRAWMPEDRVVEAQRHDKLPYSEWIRDGFLKTTPGNVVDYAFVRAEILALSKQYKILEIPTDPWNASETINKLDDAGLTIYEFQQGFKSFNEPSKEFERLVIAGRIRHDGHPVLKSHAMNTTIRMDEQESIKPTKSKSKGRIDLIVCAIMALGRAMHFEPDVYESRGVLTI